MKDLLNKLSREDLKELYLKYYPDDVNNAKRYPGKVMVSRLAKVHFDEEDLALLKGTAEQELIDEVEDKESLFSQEVQKAEVTIKDMPQDNDLKNMLPYDEEKNRLLTTQEIEMKANTANKKTLRHLISKEKAKALETVIVEVTPADKRDVALGKNCEVFSTGNMHFTVTCAVPFGTPTEVPKCIAQVINETYIYRYVYLDENEQKKRPYHPTTLRQRVKKYNLSVYTKEDFQKRKNILN